MKFLKSLAYDVDVGVTVRTERNFSSFHQNVRKPLGETISRPAMTFTTPIVFIHHGHIHIEREFAIIPAGSILALAYHPITIAV